VTLGLGGIGLIAHKPRLTNAAIDLGKSLVVTAAVVGIVKVSVDRTRPSGSRYSFPSGHTATAFTVSTVLDKHFGWKVGLAAYSTAVLTGLARMEDDHHYLSDVIAGATIGLLVGRIVPSRYGNATPYINATGRSAGLSFQF
jgi:membrane-associated phospholipid phosphatase